VVTVAPSADPLNEDDREASRKIIGLVASRVD
jgi:hypothetical protein